MMVSKEPVPELLLTSARCSNVCAREIYILSCESERKMKANKYITFTRQLHKNKRAFILRYYAHGDQNVLATTSSSERRSERK